MKRNKITLLLAFIGIVPLAMAKPCCCLTAGMANIAELEIANPSDFARTDALAEVDLFDLGIPIRNKLATELVAILDDRVVPSQLVDTDADGRLDTLHILLDLEPGEKVQIVLKKDPQAALAQSFPKRSQAELSRKTGGQWEDGIYRGGEFVPVNEVSFPGQLIDHNFYMRYEGPGWESDKVGFRMYLDQRNATDIFGKRTSAMVLQNVGLDGYESYHEDAPWGLDILKVGLALGPGGIGQWDGESALRVTQTDKTLCRIVQNGPLTSSFSLNYWGWATPAGKRDLAAMISISAGSWLTRVTVDQSRDGYPLVTGIPRHPAAEVIHGDTDIPGNSWTWLATFGKQSLDGANLGIVIFLKRDYLDTFERDASNELVVFQRRGATATYYMGAVWEGRSEHARTKENFLRFINRTAMRLDRQLRVRVKSVAMEAAIEECPPADNPLVWTSRLADSILERRGDSLSNGYVDPVVHSRASWRYTTGLLTLSLYRCGEYMNVPRYTDYAESTISSFVNESGEIATYSMSDYNIDKINSGKMLLMLLEKTGEKRFKEASGVLLRQLKQHPRTSGGAFWHKQRYPGQVWLDGVYMAAPFMAQAGKLFDEPHYYEEVDNEFTIVRNHLYDDKTGLYYHGWDELREQAWADPETGLSETFWGRGMGWFAMALVDCLDYLPDGPEANNLKSILEDFAIAIERWQDPDSGLWSQIVHEKDRTGNYLEASASSMFVYTLAKGVNKGYLDPRFAKLARKGYDGMVRKFLVMHPDGSLSLDHTCKVAGLGFGRDGSYNYYMAEPVVKNDEKGLGPFLMAGIEVDKLNDSER